MRGQHQINNIGCGGGAAATAARRKCYLIKSTTSNPAMVASSVQLKRRVAICLKLMRRRAAHFHLRNTFHLLSESRVETHQGHLCRKQLASHLQERLWQATDPASASKTACTPRPCDGSRCLFQDVAVKCQRELVHESSNIAPSATACNAQAGK